MYQIYAMVNKILTTSSEDGAQTLANWHNSVPTSPQNLQDNNNDEAFSAADHDEEDEDLSPTNLKLVIIVSGKRKSGKDHISTLITNYVGYDRMQNISILRVAGPIKREFARNNKLDFSRLLDSTSYKEKYRLSMVEWSEQYRAKVGWNCFLRAAIKEQRAKNKSVWILNDARRPCDLEYFDNDPAFENTEVIKLRVEASDSVRLSRGWKFTEGIDDKDTECGLDYYDGWTYVIKNNHNDFNQSLIDSLNPIYEAIDAALGPRVDKPGLINI